MYRVVDNHCFDTVSASVLQNYASSIYQSINFISCVASMNHNSTLTKITCNYVVLSFAVTVLQQLQPAPLQLHVIVLYSERQHFPPASVSLFPCSESSVPPVQHRLGQNFLRRK